MNLSEALSILCQTTGETYQAFAVLRDAYTRAEDHDRWATAVANERGLGMAELKAARKLIEVLLKEDEYSVDGGYCRCCDGLNPARKHWIDKDTHVGHKPDCLRQAALDAWQKARGEG